MTNPKILHKTHFTAQNRKFAMAIALAASLFTGSVSAAPLTLPSKPVLTLAAAKEVAAAGETYALANKAPGGAIAVVDDTGTLVVLMRLDGSFPMAAEVATGKARTAAMFRRASAGFEEAINSGRVALTTVPGLVGLQGGVPIEVGGQIIGAVGVSGASSAAQDTEIATAAAKAAATLLKAAP
jgi:Uncharacterized protein, possibly involved in utilization of glycolate and propanediol